MNIGIRIKLARERLSPEITQDALAEQLGVSDKAVSGWERGGRPDSGRLPELRRILRVTYMWLLEGTGDPPHPDDPQVRLEDLASELEMAKQRAPRKVPAQKSR